MSPATKDHGTAAVLTVLMPVNEHHEGFLREAVGSILAQTDPRWRLLLIGEESVRGDLERVLAHPLADARVGLVMNQGRKLAGALNTGMRIARTDFVAIALGDDLWAPDAVEVLAREIAAHPEADFFHSSRRIIDQNGDSLSSVYEARPDVTLSDFGGAAPVKHLLCWRRELGLRVGMDESLNSVGPDDYDFPWSMAEAGAEFRAVPECLYIYRDHRESFRLTTHLPRSHHKREIRRMLRKHGVPEDDIRDLIAAAEKGQLRQCLYGSRPARWLRRLTGDDPYRAPREEYR